MDSKSDSFIIEDYTVKISVKEQEGQSWAVAVCPVCGLKEEAIVLNNKVKFAKSSVQGKISIHFSKYGRCGSKKS